MKKLKELRKSKGLKQADVAKALSISTQVYCNYENGQRQPNPEMLQKLADFFGVSVDYLLGRDELPRNVTPFSEKSFRRYPVIGTIRAGYDGRAVEEFTGEYQEVPESVMHGYRADELFVLNVSGDSMYPFYLDGDRVLICRQSSVDPGTIAAVLYDGEEATLKKVNYVSGEDWVELIPLNPMFKTKKIEGADLEECRILGKVVYLFRKI